MADAQSTHHLSELRAELSESIAVKQRILADQALLDQILAVSQCVHDALRTGNKLLLAGNGGSASDAQHIATELVGRFLVERAGLPALSLAADSSALTALGNDYGFEHVFRRQLEALARRGDVFIGITTSGRSPNIVQAWRACRALGVVSVALCARGGQLEGEVDHVIRVPSSETPRIQEAHIAIGHLICSFVERQWLADSQRPVQLQKAIKRPDPIVESPRGQS